MRIGIDIDDTLTDTSEITLEYAKKYNDDYDNKLLPNMYEMLRGASKEEKIIEFQETYIKEICSKVKIKKDAKEIIDLLLNDGHEIYLITARSDNFFDDAQKFTEDYLKKNNINYTALVTGHIYKTEIVKELNIDVFFDDAYDTVKTLYNEGIDAVLYISMNNKYLCTSLNKVKSWKELYNYICNK